MTDKEKVNQLLLDNGFELINKRRYRNQDFKIYISELSHALSIEGLEGGFYTIINSYRELVGFLYLKYGKVYISEK